MTPPPDDRPAALPASRRDALRAFDAAAHTPPPPLPPGRYRAEVLDGRLSSTASGKPTYRMAFEVSDGPHTGRRLWRQWYFTPAAVPYTWRDLGRFGLTTAAHLEQPFPTVRTQADLTVGSWVDDNGVARPDVKAVDPVELPAAGR